MRIRSRILFLAIIVSAAAVACEDDGTTNGDSDVGAGDGGGTSDGGADIGEADGTPQPLCEAATDALSLEVARGPDACCSLVAEIGETNYDVLGYELFCTNDTNGNDSDNVVYEVLDGEGTAVDLALETGVNLVRYDSGFELQQNSGAVILAVNADASVAFPSWRDGEDLLGGVCESTPPPEEPVVVDLDADAVDTETDGTFIWAPIDQSIVPDALLNGSAAFVSNPTIVHFEGEDGATRWFVVLNAGYESCVL